jgi:hypothetical protein
VLGLVEEPGWRFARLFCDRQVRDIGWPAAPDLWVQSSLKRRQRFPQLLFPDGIALDGNGCIRAAQDVRPCVGVTIGAAGRRAASPTTLSATRSAVAPACRASGARRLP